MQNNKKTLWKVIGASSLGTLIEWYDFFIFGSLSVVLATKFFPADNPTAAFLSTLATFAAGFVVRPFGALFFGRLGDMIGRKYTFMVTLMLMGGATFLIGCTPSYESIGFLHHSLYLFSDFFKDWLSVVSMEERLHMSPNIAPKGNAGIGPPGYRQRPPLVYLYH